MGHKSLIIIVVFLVALTEISSPVEGTRRTHIDGVPQRKMSRHQRRQFIVVCCGVLGCGRRNRRRTTTPASSKSKPSENGDDYEANDREVTDAHVQGDPDMEQSNSVTDDSDIQQSESQAIIDSGNVESGGAGSDSGTGGAISNSIGISPAQKLDNSISGGSVSTSNFGMTTKRPSNSGSILDSSKSGGLTSAPGNPGIIINNKLTSTTRANPSSTEGGTSSMGGLQGARSSGVASDVANSAVTNGAFTSVVESGVSSSVLANGVTNAAVESGVTSSVLANGAISGVPYSTAGNGASVSVVTSGAPFSVLTNVAVESGASSSVLANGATNAAVESGVTSSVLANGATNAAVESGVTSSVLGNGATNWVPYSTAGNGASVTVVASGVPSSVLPNGATNAAVESGVSYSTVGNSASVNGVQNSASTSKFETVNSSQGSSASAGVVNEVSTSRNVQGMSSSATTVGGSVSGEPTTSLTPGVTSLLPGDVTSSGVTQGTVTNGTATTTLPGSVTSESSSLSMSSSSSSVGVTSESTPSGTTTSPATTLTTFVPKVDCPCLASCSCSQPNGVVVTSNGIMKSGVTGNWTFVCGKELNNSMQNSSKCCVMCYKYALITPTAPPGSAPLDCRIEMGNVEAQDAPSVPGMAYSADKFVGQCDPFKNGSYSSMIEEIGACDKEALKTKGGMDTCAILYSLVQKEISIKSSSAVPGDACSMQNLNSSSNLDFGMVCVNPTTTSSVTTTTGPPTTTCKAFVVPTYLGDAKQYFLDGYNMYNVKAAIAYCAKLPVAATYKLADIQTKEENDLIKSYLNPYCLRGKIWTAGFEVSATSPNTYWWSNTTAFTYTDWASGQPSGFSNARILLNGVENYQWMEKNETSTYGVLCELK